jgi:hypothetical protein
MPFSNGVQKLLRTHARAIAEPLGKLDHGPGALAMILEVGIAAVLGLNQVIVACFASMAVAVLEPAHELSEAAECRGIGLLPSLRL